MAQYDFTPPLAFAGMIAGLGPRHVRSMINEVGTALPFGIAVKRGTTDDVFALVSAAADEVVGILVHQHAVDQRTLLTTEGVLIAGTADVMAKGVIHVLVEEAVTPASPVYVRIANGVADTARVQKGAFRASADTLTAKRLHGARYLTTTAADGYAQLMFDFSASSAAKDAISELDTIVLTAGTEAANAIDVVGQLKTVLGTNLAVATQVRISALAVTADQGDLAAASTPVGTLKKAVTPATGENVAWMETTSGGAFSFKVSNTAAEDTLVEVQAEGCRPRLLKLTFA